MRHNCYAMHAFPNLWTLYILQQGRNSNWEHSFIKKVLSCEFSWLSGGYKYGVTAWTFEIMTHTFSTSNNAWRYLSIGYAGFSIQIEEFRRFQEPYILLAIS